MYYCCSHNNNIITGLNLYLVSAGWVYGNSENGDIIVGNIIQCTKGMSSHFQDQFGLMLHAYSLWTKAIRL